MFDCLFHIIFYLFIPELTCSRRNAESERTLHGEEGGWKVPGRGCLDLYLPSVTFPGSPSKDSIRFLSGPGPRVSYFSYKSLSSFCPSDKLCRLTYVVLYRQGTCGKRPRESDLLLKKTCSFCVLYPTFIKVVFFRFMW